MNHAAMAAHNAHVQRRRRMASRAHVARVAPAAPPPPPPIYVPPPPEHDSHVVEYRLFETFRASRSVEAVAGGGASVREIVAATARHFRIGTADILGKGQTVNVVNARHFAIYVARKVSGRSFPDLGNRFGRHHTTILHACEKIAARVASGDLEAILDIEAIEWSVAKKLKARTSKTVH